MSARRTAHHCALTLSVTLATLIAGPVHAGPMDGSIVGGVITAPQGQNVMISGGTFNTTGNPYTADGHVVGPNGSSYTLANLDNAGFYTGSLITVTFSKPIYAVSFDYEIFPNINLTNGTTTTTANPNWPVFIFLANGSQIFETYGVVPNSSPTGGTMGYVNSPDDDPEYAPQFIGSSGLITFANGVTTLEFEDWPPTIAVGKINFYGSPPAPPTVPEPSTLAIFGGVVAAACAVRRRRQAAEEKST